MIIGEITADNKVVIVDAKTLKTLKEKAMANAKKIEEEAMKMNNEIQEEKTENLNEFSHQQNNEHWKLQCACMLYTFVTLPFLLGFVIYQVYKLIFG